MKLYHYHETTGVFLWSDNARLDPLETELRGAPVFIIPALATKIAPPSETPENHIAFFDFEDATPQWKFVEIAQPEPEPELPPVEPGIDPNEPPAQVIPTISKRQFWQQIALIGWVPFAEAVAFMATGTLPEAFETALATLDEADPTGVLHFKARMSLMANEYERSNAFVPMLGELFDRDDEQIDALFLGASQAI
jgi:hypothetical protein